MNTLNWKVDCSGYRLMHRGVQYVVAYYAGRYLITADGVEIARRTNSTEAKYYVESLCS